MSETHIQIDNVNAYYSEHPALKNISVYIPKKQITAIIGPSGCGKSTLLKCMNRLIDLTDGGTYSGKILKIIVDDITAVTEVPRGMEADGHVVLSVKQKNKTDWEIGVRKKG